jgi:hypothetical protein
MGVGGRGIEKRKEQRGKGGDLGREEQGGERERVGGKARRRVGKSREGKREKQAEQAGEETGRGPRGSRERVKEEQGNREGKQENEVVVANQLCLLIVDHRHDTSKPVASSLRKLAEFENSQKIPI